MIAVFEGLKCLFTGHNEQRNWKKFWEKLSPEERLTYMIEKGIEILLEDGEAGNMFVFTIPKTDHEAQLTLSRKPRRGGDFWLFSVGVVRKGSDRLHSHYLCSGEGQEGKEKVLSYLARPELKTEVIASVKELSRHVDQDD